MAHLLLLDFEEILVHVRAIVMTRPKGSIVFCMQATSMHILTQCLCKCYLNIEHQQAKTDHEQFSKDMVSFGDDLPAHVPRDHVRSWLIGFFRASLGTSLIAIVYQSVLRFYITDCHSLSVCIEVLRDYALPDLGLVYSQTSLIRSSFIRIPRHKDENRWLPIYSICRAYIQYVCSIIRFPLLSGYFCEKRTCAVMRGLTVVAKMLFCN